MSAQEDCKWILCPGWIVFENLLDFKINLKFLTAPFCLKKMIGFKLKTFIFNNI